MKTTCLIVLLSGFWLLSTQGQTAQSPTANSSSSTGLAQQTPYVVVERGANDCVWQRLQYEQASNGQIITNLHQYIELATGLNYWQNGQWVGSKEEIDILSNGTAAATNGQHQAYFPGDIYQGQIELVTPDGQQLYSRPLGLSYFDGTNSVLIAELTNSIGVLSDSNQVIYQTNNNTVGFTNGFYSGPLLGQFFNGYGSSYFAGDIAEVLIFNRALTTDERTTVNGYLNGKYGLVPAVPATPTNLIATAISQSQISLTWDEVLNGGATQISIERSTTNNGGFTAVAQIPAKTSYVDTNLTAGTTYYYRVRALNLTQWSDYSGVAYATTLTTGADLPFGTLLALWLKADAGLVQGNCKFKFAYRNRNVCPRCDTPIEKMANPLFLHYTYYHCSKSGRPVCRQKCVSGQELEKQINECLACISISERFKEWAIKYLHELHEKETASQNDIIQAQQKAYQECLGQIDSLVNLKTSSGNKDGSLLSDDEYARRRGKLLKEKSALEELLNDAGHRLEQQLKLSEQTFEFACAAQKRFAEGDPKTKKEILATIGSNLILKDKKLLIEARKPFFILENTLSPEKPIISPIEPEKTKVAQGRRIPSIFMRPYLLGDLDDVRTYGYKAERAAALIYAHFKKEFGFPAKH